MEFDDESKHGVEFGSSNRITSGVADDDQRPDKKNLKKKPPAALCGYMTMTRFSASKLIKKSKRYWFIYADNSCKLYYFRTQESTNHSGSIDICRASFALDVENPTTLGLFSICTRDEKFDLETNDRNAALYWLQELQKRRRRHSRKRTANIKKHGLTVAAASAGNFCDGLLERYSSDEQLLDDYDIPPLVELVEPPRGAVGEDSAKVQHSLSNNLFSNFRSQIRNGIVNMRYSRTSEVSNSSNDEWPSSPTSPTTQQHVEQRIFSKANTFKGRSSFRTPRPFSFLSKESNSQSSTDNFCKNCEKINEELAEMHNSNAQLKEEVKSNKAMIVFLQRQLDLACRQKESVMKLQIEPNIECHMQLAIEKDIELARLNEILLEVKNELEDVKLQYVAQSKEMTELRKYDQEVIDLKNDIIDQLTEQVASLEMQKVTMMKVDQDEEPFVVVLRHHRNDVPQSGEHSYSEDDKLKDEVQAFRIQNKFLNSEILQLNLLREDSEEREALVKFKCIEWESKFYVIQSKYLVLLNEYHSPTRGSVESFYSQESASQLLHDAIMDKSGPDYMSIAKVINSDDRYDIYGFSHSSPSASFSLLQEAYLLRQRSVEIDGKLKDPYAEMWSSKWDQFMACQGKRRLQTSPLLKELIRSGIPFVHRSVIWKGCIELQVRQMRENKPKMYYESLLSMKNQRQVLDMAAKQIELDLLRTLPHNKHFENAHSDGIPKLRRILLAYSRHNPDVGYCQGLNRLGAIALLFLKEEDAFWCLVSIIEYLMPSDYYNRELIGAQVDQLVLKDLLQEKCPRFHDHLERHNMDISLFTFNWFMCIFVDCVPIETYLFMWDTFLYEGSKVLFRYALSVLRLCEEECLKASDSMGISKTLRSILEGLTDWKRLAQRTLRTFWSIWGIVTSAFNYSRRHLLDCEILGIQSLKCRPRPRVYCITPFPLSSLNRRDYAQHGSVSSLQGSSRYVA